MLAHTHKPNILSHKFRHEPSIFNMVLEANDLIAKTHIQGPKENLWPMRF